MITIVTEPIDLYEYKELEEESQENALNQRIGIWIETIPVDTVSHNSNFYKAYKEAERMKTPWFFGSYVYDYCKDQLLKELKTMYFTIDGKFYNYKEYLKNESICTI